MLTGLVAGLLFWALALADMKAKEAFIVFDYCEDSLMERNVYVDGVLVAKPLPDVTDNRMWVAMITDVLRGHFGVEHIHVTVNAYDAAKCKKKGLEA